jgi:hypothetical protein
MAKNVTFNYVWLNFEAEDAVSKGRVELSKDGGATWQSAELKIEGSLIHGHVGDDTGYNAVRWINASDGPVDFKIVRFNVDLAERRD